MQKKFVNCFIICISILFTLIIMELGARFYVIFFPQPPELFEFRKVQPLPYKDAPFFSQEFINESHKQPGEWLYPKGTRLIIPSDFRGKFFNVENGCRVTKFQPVSHQNSAYIFGGSTVLRKVGQQLSIDMNLNSYDLSSILDERDSSTDEYYLDFCHVENKGNKKIAGKIFSILYPVIKK